MTETTIHLTGAVAQPGDLVLITVPEHYDDRYTQVIGDLLGKIAPDSISFVLLKGDIQITVTRPT